MSLRPLKRYLTLVFGLSATIVVVASGISITVDPYDYYHGVRWEGINAKKPHALTHGRLAKLAAASRVEPNTVVLGNSRMDIGFDPHSNQWPDALRPIFNLAIPGQGPSGDLRNIQELFHHQKPKLVVIGVDFLDFLYDGNTTSQALPDKPTEIEKLKVTLRNATATALSITAVGDSLRTVAQQNDPNVGNMTYLGFNPFRQFLEHVRIEGHHGLFHQKNVENIRNYLRKPKIVVGPNGNLSSSFEAMIQIIRWCNQHSVPIKLIIYPYHLEILEGFRQTGLWPAFEEWKRLLVKIISAEQLDARPHDVALWDFSGYHRYATESVPKKGDTHTHMRWYWEAGHFKSALGDVMLRTILHGEAKDGFGIQLSLENVESLIGRIRTDDHTYRSGKSYRERDLSWKQPKG
jgi:hypothetical protein